MAETIFFSWQADTSTTCGRNLIERALEIALRGVASAAVVDEAVRDSLVVDKDTKGVSGSPPIVETILRKIDQAVIFVPDLTFVGRRIDGRPTPNPNVLIEYGWALKAHGHGHIVPVMNTAHGEPNDANLPFDLKHLRHPITYNCPDNADEATRKAARAHLAKTLTAAIKAVLTSAEYKARRTYDSPFVARQAVDGAGRFRDLGEPLGLYDGHEGQDLILVDWPLMWFRMMPLRTIPEEFPVTRLKAEITPAPNTNRLTTFNPVAGAVLGVRGADGYGTWNPAPGDSTGRMLAAGVAYAFSNGEVWTVEGSGLRNAKGSNAIPMNEGNWVRLLLEHSEFLKGLKIEPPYEWIAGMEDLKGRGIWIKSDPYKPFGSCLSDRIEVKGRFSPGEDPKRTLEPFFAKLYDACGMRRTS